MAKQQLIELKFSEFKSLTEQGFAPDFQTIDRILIRNNKCPNCGKSLVYQGFSNAESYHAFGTCEPCDYAKLFWTETVEKAIAKRRLSRRRAAQVS